MSDRNAWIIDGFLDVRGDHLHIDGVAAVSLAEKYGSPLFVYSESRIRHNIERIAAVANVIPFSLKLCYAAKAMPTLGILRAVKNAGVDIEVNSGGELWKALKAGFTGPQIIFNGTSKEVWEIELAIKSGIYAIQVDSLFELSLIEETARRLKKRASVSLRLVPEIESGTHSGLQTALLTSKFGMMPDEAFEGFRKYKDSPHLDLCGIHLHIGSQNPDPKVYAEALEKLFICLAVIYGESGVKVRHVNLGGGFPVNYLRDNSQERDIPPEQRAMFSASVDPVDAIANAWATIEPIVNLSELNRELAADLMLLLEPGRSIIADAGVCLTTVRNKKERRLSKHAKGKVDDWLLTDAGFNLLLSQETYKWYYHMISASRAGEPHKTKYKLAGPLCDGGDVYFDIEGENRLPDHRLLPKNVEVGELLALLNCGAYSLSQASQYNGRGLPAVVLIRADGKPNLIRKRDTLEDLIAGEI
ncbi:MAG: diaminopimelate decarboxylase [Acidobacteria bacterium]|nr:diaminopimelate decarboxylase [Acidobacteriota bacterium]